MIWGYFVSPRISARTHDVLNSKLQPSKSWKSELYFVQSSSRLRKAPGPAGSKVDVPSLMVTTQRPNKVYNPVQLLGASTKE